MTNHRSAYRCPNENCKNHTKPQEGRVWFVKNGYYKTEHDGKAVPRYKCKDCGKCFSSHTFSDTKGQHKPELNKQVFTEYDSNVSLNRLAKNLKVQRRTVVKKFRWLATKSRAIHEKTIEQGKLKSSVVQFDEMETFEHTRKKPLAVALAVRVLFDEVRGVYRSFEIIDAKVAVMPAWGLQKAESEAKYGKRDDDRVEAIKGVLNTVKRVGSPDGLTIQVDQKSQYPGLIKNVLPEAEVQQTSRKKNSGNEFDPMFCLNHTCARIRHDLSRMARKSWVTTKNPQGLQYHLDLYMAYMNGYDLFG